MPSTLPGCLIGRLLPLYLLSTLPSRPRFDLVRFATSSHGRPSLASPLLSPLLDYNVSHDGSFVVLVYARSSSTTPRVGVDVMKLALPSSFDSAEQLIEILSDQLSPNEHAHLLSLLSPALQIRETIRLWMYKEAVSKLIGLGSALDFSQLDFTPSSSTEPSPATAIPSRSLAFIYPVGKLPAHLPEGLQLPPVDDEIAFYEGRLRDARSGEMYRWVAARSGGVERLGKEGREGISSVRSVDVEQMVERIRRWKGEEG